MTLSGRLTFASAPEMIPSFPQNAHKIPVSVLGVVTRPESYMYQLGIVTDYTAIIAGNSNVHLSSHWGTR